eukprot:gene903-10658_t
MIRVQDNLQEDVNEWQDFDGKYAYPPGVAGGGARHPSNRSSFCSTCSSYESEYWDEDGSIRDARWSPYIQADGSLFYLEPYYEPQQHQHAEKEGKDSTSKASAHPGKKDEPRAFLRGFGRIKGALKRSTTFAKKEKEDESRYGKGKDAMGYGDNENSPFENREQLFDYETERKTTVIKVEKGIAQTPDSNSSLLEDLIGIISGLDLDPVLPLPDANGNHDTAFPRRLNAIAIQGISQSSPADANQDIDIGDTLLAVNGMEVNQRNINYVLSKMRWPNEAVLTIEKIVATPAKPKIKSKIIDLLTANIENEDDLAAFQEYCAVMYLTLDADEKDPLGDILFWYPESKYSKKFKDIRGIFLTLADLMPSVTGTEVKSTTLLIKEQIIHACYHKIGENVLVIAVPDIKCSLLRLEQNVRELMRQIEYLYHSAEQAFLSEFREDVQHTFLLFMERLLHGLPIKSQSEVSNLTADHFGGVKYLPLPAEKYVSISNVLSDAEAADYGDYADDFFPHRRLYTILGSCLFYKGHVVCNHLPDEDLMDCLVFCKHHCVLAMTEEQRVSSFIVWKEVYPLRRKAESVVKENHFEEPLGRWFLLVVALKHSLLCMLLEAGGSSSTPEGNPGPHPYYVDRATSILAYIQENRDFETICEAKLRGSAVPAMASMNDVSSSRQSQNNSHLEITLRKLPAHLETMAMQNSPSVDSLRTLGEESPRSNGHKMSSPFPSRTSESKLSDDSGSNSSSMRMSVSSFPATSSSFKNSPNANWENTLISTKITAGIPNTLFYYASRDKARGIVLCPTNSCSDLINKEVLDNFYKACELIRRAFDRDSNQKIGDSEDDDDGDKVYEQGLLFRRKPLKGGDLKKSQNVLKYWVVGRRLADESKEFFICFHDGVPQSAIEMAFNSFDLLFVSQVKTQSRPNQIDEKVSRRTMSPTEESPQETKRLKILVWKREDRMSAVSAVGVIGRW